MALRMIEGQVEELGPATALVAEAGQTGTSWTFVTFSQRKRRPVTLEKVVADPTIGARLVAKQAGRFAFYSHDGQSVLCGFAGSEGDIELAALANDPAAIAADAIRLPAKRKILLGILLIPTIIGLFFAVDMIRTARRTLQDNPAPRRPSDARVTRALKGQFFWPL
jgi:hypothetical protein